MNDKLTADEIRSMEAGYKMDNLIAELIFERTFCTVHHSFHCCGRSDPKWSTNIAAAWEVHRAMLSRDPQTKTRYLYALADMLIDKFVGRSRPPSVWTALLEYFDEDTICRAALLAVAEVNERVKQIDCV